MRAFTFPFILLSLALAGCVVPAETPETSCDNRQLAPLRMGSIFVLNATGTRLALPGVNGIVVDWRLADPPAEGQGSPRLDVGSKLEIHVAAQTVPRLASDGINHDAVEVRYVLSIPGKGRIAVAQEWLDAETGELMQTSLMNVLSTSLGVFHSIHLQRAQREAAFLFHRQWDVSGRADGESWNVAAGWFAPGTTRLTYHRLAGCSWAIDFVMGTGDAATFPMKARMTFQAGLPFPVSYVEADASFFQGLSLKLWTHDLGTGPVVGNSGSASTAFPPTVPVSQVAGACCAFPTSMRRAQEAVEATTSYSEWLRDHPNAQLSSWTHLMGQPSSDIRDAWKLVYSDGAEARSWRVANVTRLVNPLGVMGDFEISSEDSTASAILARVVSMDRLQSLHEAWFGTRAEVIECFGWERACNIGRHDAVGMPREGATGASAMILVGLKVDMATGSIIQEESFDDTPLGPQGRHLPT